MLERASFKGSARCLTLEGGFSLWEEYVAEAEAALAGLPNAQTRVNYERFLGDPRHPTEGLESLAAFCGLEVTPEGIEKALSQIKPSRASAFLKDPELAAFHEKVKQTPWMERYGYSVVSSI